MRRLLSFILPVMVGCAMGESPPPVEEAPSKQAPAPAVSSAPEGEPWQGPCDRSTKVVIQGQTFWMPVECNPDYIYTGYPLPFMFPMSLILKTAPREK